MKRLRERRRGDSGPIMRSMAPAAGRRSTAAYAYGAVPAMRTRDEGAPIGDGRPRLLGPGWGHFMPSLEEEDLDDPRYARTGMGGGDAAAEEEVAGLPDVDEESEIEGVVGGEEDAEAGAAREGEGEAEGEADAGREAGGQGEAEGDAEGADGVEAVESPQGAVDAAVAETGDVVGPAAAMAGVDEEDDDGVLGLADDEEADADDDGREGAVAPVQLRGTGRRGLASVDGERARGRAASAARLGPIDPPIPRPRPGRRRKPSLDRILRGKGWRKIGMEGVRMKRSGSTVILAIDRHNRRVKLDVTSAQRRFSLPRQARKQGAAIAINGDLFGFASGKPSGLHRRNGRNLSGSKRQPGSAMFAFEKPHGGRVGILSGNNRLPRWANNVVSGRPIIVKDGRVVQRYAPADQARLNSRTGRSAVGLSRDGRVMFLATAGRATTKEMANLLKRSGADDALALDGSGSAQMYLRGKGRNRGMVRRGDGRHVANAILVKTRG
jgi:uncharacterized protein YigE (DUF2233 family)